MNLDNRILGSEVPIKGKGDKSLSEKRLNDQMQRHEVLEQSTTDVGQPPEVPRTSVDKLEEECSEKKVQEAIKMSKQYISDKQRASLAKARKILAEKRRYKRLEGKAKNQGTPAPDLLTNIQNQITSGFESVHKELESLRRVIPLEDPVHLDRQIRKPTEFVHAEPIPSLYGDEMKVQKSVPAREEVISYLPNGPSVPSSSVFPNSVVADRFVRKYPAASELQFRHAKDNPPSLKRGKMYRGPEEMKDHLLF